MSLVVNVGKVQTSSIVTILVSGTVSVGQTSAVAIQLTVNRVGANSPQYFSMAKQYIASNVDLIVSDTISMTIIPKLGTGDTISFSGSSSLLVQIV